MSLVSILLQCSGEQLANESPPIFENEHINAWYAVDRFIFDTPDEVKYLVLGIFSDEQITDGEKILGPEGRIAGSRSGLNGFGINSVNLVDIYDYVSTQGDFDELNH
jgi:hypothetical protein